MSKRRKPRRRSRKRAQILYLMINFPLIFLVKIGITGNLQQREKNISETTPGIAVPVIAFYLYNAHGLEQWLHRVLAPLNVRLKGSGGTEWFLILGLVIALPVLILRQIIDFTVLVAVVMISAVIIAKISILVLG